MSDSTKNLIAATVTIVQMNRDGLQTTLLDLLASNPSIILKALDMQPSFYKVVLSEYTNNKVNLIKGFREETGAGLADSKAWSEGETYNGCPSGTFKRGMSRADADALAAKMNHQATNAYTAANGYQYSPTGIKVKVVRDTENHDYASLVSWTLNKPNTTCP